MQSENLSENIQQDGLKKEEDKKGKLSSEEEALLKKKIIIGKIVIVCTAIVCVSMVIFILAKSSTFFSFLFSLDTEKIIKSYLRLHFTSYMTALYFSIFGLVIAIADTTLFFFKFSQKNKLIWFHAGYYLAIFIVIIVAVSNKDYNSYLEALKGKSLASSACTNAAFALECMVASPYFEYRSNFITFFIVFSVFFAIFTAAYHYYVLYIVPFEAQSSKQQDDNKSVIFNNIQTHQNETFVSEMFDEYGN